MVNEMTKYYLIKTNVSRDVVAVCNDKMYVCPEKSGVDVNSGIDIYADNVENVVEALTKAYDVMIADGTLYNMDDIDRDFPDSVISDNVESFFENDVEEECLICALA